MQISPTASMALAVEREEDYTYIPVYSPFALDEIVTPDRAGEIHRAACDQLLTPREKYPPLPWTMGELIGTTWRNVHTGSPTEVVTIEKDRWQNPELRIQIYRARGVVVPWTLGLWTNDRHREEGRYVTEHWVRIDHVAAEDQLPWFRFRLDCIQAQIAFHTEQLAECVRTGDRANRKFREQDLEFDRCELAYAQAQLRDFEIRFSLLSTEK